MFQKCLTRPANVGILYIYVYYLLNYIKRRGFMKHYFIINPAAGKGTTTNDLIVKIVSAANAEDIDFRIYETKRQGDATRYVISKCEAHRDIPLRFYACGGDGTLNEVINAVANYDNAQVAVIPVGTGNDYVKNFSNIKHFMNIKRQICGAPVKIDLIKYNGNYCANVLNVGFDCAVVQKMSDLRRSKYCPNKFAYVGGIISALAHKYGTKLKLQLDDEVLEGEFLLAAFGKGSFYGGGFKALPLTISDDGYIDTCVAKKISRPSFINCIGKYKKGEHLDLSFISYKKCRKVRLESEEPIGICADGEVTIGNVVEVEVAPRALNFSLPQGCTLNSICGEDQPSEATADYNYQEV